VKRAIAGLGALFLAGATLAPTVAATTYQGAVKFTYTIPASFTAVLATNFVKSQGTFSANSPATILGSTAGCSTGIADTNAGLTLTYGTITPPATGVIGCDYIQAIGISINTNDASGYSIYETLDLGSAPSNYGLCVIPDGSTTTPSATTPTGATTAATAGTFTGSVMTSCAAGGTILGPAQGTVANAGVSGQPLTSPTSANESGTPTAAEKIFTVSSLNTGTNYFGEDVQLNIPSTAPSTTTAVTDAIIVYFVAN